MQIEKLNVYRWIYSLDTLGAYITETEELILENTAIVVIDPWKETPFKKVDNEVSKNIKKYVLPMIKIAIEKKCKIFIFTNGPTGYPTEILDELYYFVDGEAVKLLYHNDFKSGLDFGKYCEESHIFNLIYTGYSIHACILFRRVGLISLYESEYRNKLHMYIVPEATLACVSEAEEENEAMKKDICIMVSQQKIAKIIKFTDFIDYCNRINF